jgi:hypothetical protein
MAASWWRACQRIHRQNVEVKNVNGKKNADGKNLEWDKRLTEKTMNNNRKALKRQNVEW